MIIMAHWRVRGCARAGANTWNRILEVVIVSADGVIITNKHVVADTEASYKVIFE